MFSFNPIKTNERRAKLEAYFNNHIMEQRNFICQYYAECKNSQNGYFYEGQSHYFGNYYDIKKNGISFRISVVGQEYGGGPPFVTLTERSIHILASAYQAYFKKNYKDKYRSYRNSHMKGTTSILRLLFDKGLGNNWEDEFIMLENGQMIHIFEAFALTNYLLCSAVIDPNKRRGCSSKVMKTNCSSHFKAVMEILEPNILIVQSKTYWSYVLKNFDYINPIDEIIYESKINNSTTYLLKLSHPAATGDQNWGTNDKTEYLKNVIAPSIIKLHKLIGAV